MSDKKHWLTKIVPVLAFSAGIIMASVGGIMTLSSTAKLALFENGPYIYIDQEQCRYNYHNQIKHIDPETGTEIEKPPEKTDSEIKTCLENRRMEEKSRFQNGEKQDIVDGLSALVVGFLLILFFRKKKS